MSLDAGLQAIEGSENEILLKLSALGIEGDDPVVKLTAIAYLEQLAKTPYQGSALELLLSAVKSKTSIVRVRVAKVLKHFDDPKAEAALLELRQDPDHRVVAATLEVLL